MIMGGPYSLRLTDLPGRRDDWRQVEGTSIVTNGHVAIRLPRSYPSLKVARDSAGMIATEDDLTRGAERLCQAAATDDDSMSNDGTYYTLEDNRPRALLAWRYLRLANNPASLIATASRAEEKFKPDGVNFNGVLVDSYESPSFWISPIQEDA